MLIFIPAFVGHPLGIIFSGVCDAIMWGCFGLRCAVRWTQQCAAGFAMGRTSTPRPGRTACCHPAQTRLREPPGMHTFPTPPPLQHQNSYNFCNAHTHTHTQTVLLEGGQNRATGIEKDPFFWTQKCPTKLDIFGSTVFQWMPKREEKNTSRGRTSVWGGQVWSQHFLDLNPTNQQTSQPNKPHPTNRGELASWGVRGF